MFLAWRGEMRVEFRGRVAPRGVERRTYVDEATTVVLFESAATRNTGNAVDARFTAPDRNPL